jgi:hypothetical protein
MEATMIFDGKPIDEITDEELDAIVQENIRERQHLEFKVTVNYRDDGDRLELLHDISSLANGGGGYVIIGIRDDGQGRAVKFEPSLVGDTARIAKSITSLCQDHIRERIDGLGIRERNVKGNPLVVVRVPRSFRIPHMVTFSNRTDFYCRYQNGKREMTYGEIKDAFVGDEVRKQLYIVKSAISELESNVVKLGGQSIKMAELFWKMRDHFLEGIQPGSIPGDIYRIFEGADKHDCNKAWGNLKKRLRLLDLICDAQRPHPYKGTEYRVIVTTSLGTSVINELVKKWGDSPWPPSLPEQVSNKGDSQT